MKKQAYQPPPTKWARWGNTIRKPEYLSRKGTIKHHNHRPGADPSYLFLGNVERREEAARKAAKASLTTPKKATRYRLIAQAVDRIKTRAAEETRQRVDELREQARDQRAMLDPWDLGET